MAPGLSPSDVAAVPGRRLEPTGPVIFSASEDYVAAARKELTAEFAPGARVQGLGPDVGRLEAPGVGACDVARACRVRPLVFVRHLTTQTDVVPGAEAQDTDRVAVAAHETLTTWGADRSIALQVWVAGPSPLPYGSGRLHLRVADWLTTHGYDVARAGRAHVLSLCVAPSGVIVGLGDQGCSLSDWPGGRVRLARGAEQVSRAEFKLEELAGVHPLRWPSGGDAVDLGASPGGWTRILRRHGLRVWAVDPADLDARVAEDPGVRHVRTTAGRFFRESSQRFDVAVNDMRMTPLRSAQVMVDAAERLRQGGLAVMTLKLTEQHPVELVGRCLRLLRGAYEIEFARQLQHNRHEITVVGRRR